MIARWEDENKIITVDERGVLHEFNKKERDMKAEEFLYAYRRMCKNARNCNDCPLGREIRATIQEHHTTDCALYSETHPEATVRVVEEWSKGRNLRREVKKIRNVLQADPYFGIRRVIINKPATIVMWTDGSKTVVKCNEEEFDKEKGLAMALCKKVMGNKGNYYNVIKKLLKEAEGDDND